MSDMFRRIHVIQTAALLFASSAYAASLEISNQRTSISGETASFSFDFKRADGAKIENADLVTVCPDDTFSVSRFIPSAAKSQMLNEASGKLSFNVPVKYFPRGQNCEFKLKTEFVSGQPGKILQMRDSRAGMVLKDIQGTDLEIKLRFRYIGDMGGVLIPSGFGGKDAKKFSVCLRTESGVAWGPWKEWRYCMFSFQNGDEVRLEQVFLGKWDSLAAARFNYTDGQWHNVVFRVKGHQYEAEIDNKIKLSGVEKGNFSAKGGIGLAVEQAGVQIDDITVTDLSSGSMIYQDDFERGKIGWGEKWETVMAGSPPFASVDDPDFVMFIRHETHAEETSLGSIRTPPPNVNEGPLPKVEVKQYGAGVRMEINGKPVLPLIYSFANTTFNPFLDDSYTVAGKMYEQGVRLYAPAFLSQISWTSDGKIDFSCFDKTMRRMVIACPDGWIFPRLLITPPPGFPKEELLKIGRKASDPFPAKTSYPWASSLSSPGYREAYRRALNDIIEHIRAQPYHDRIIGALLLGGGYECSWGQVGGNGGMFIDVSPTAAKSFADYAASKYKTLGALRKAWDMPELDMSNIPLPGLESRTLSDAAGFRDPSKPKSRWVTDFLEFYGTES